MTNLILPAFLIFIPLFDVSAYSKLNHVLGISLYFGHFAAGEVRVAEVVSRAAHLQPLNRPLQKHSSAVVFHFCTGILKVNTERQFISVPQEWKTKVNLQLCSGPSEIPLTRDHLKYLQSIDVLSAFRALGLFWEK